AHSRGCVRSIVSPPMSISSSVGSTVWSFPDMSRKIFSCIISWITIDILSAPRMSTSGRAPWLSAIMRFWIRVESLKRPPTLLTISSSFSSSIMVVRCSTTVLGQDRGELLDGAIQVVVDDLDVILRGQFQLSAGGGQPLRDGRWAVGAPGPQPGLEDLEAGDL